MSDEGKSGASFLETFVSMGIGFVLGSIIPCIIKTPCEKELIKFKTESVCYGYARYVPDDSGMPKFEWIVPPEKKDTKP